MVEDYVQSHLAGNHVFARGKCGHKETLSCFDKTRPIAASKRPGGHGPPRVSAERRPAACAGRQGVTFAVVWAQAPDPENDPHYNNATAKFCYTSKVSGPDNYQKSRAPAHEDSPGGACTSLAVGKKEVRPIVAPVSGAFKIRQNPPNTEFRRFYERGDLPIAIEHRGVGNR